MWSVLMFCWVVWQGVAASSVGPPSARIKLTSGVFFFLGTETALALASPLRKLGAGAGVLESCLRTSSRFRLVLCLGSGVAVVGVDGASWSSSRGGEERMGVDVVGEDD